MNRRTFLARLGAASGAALGGCGAPPTASADRRTTTATTPTAQRRVAIREQDAVPDEYAIRIEARVLEPRITDTHTARVRLTLTNEGASRDIPVSTGRCALLNRYSQSSWPRGVWLAPHADDATGYVTDAGPRWTASPPENGAFPDYGCSRQRFAAGESVSTTYGVFDDARANGYLDEGRYRFERELSVWPADGTETTPVRFEWAFVLFVENPGCTLLC